MLKLIPCNFLLVFVLLFALFCCCYCVDADEVDGLLDSDGYSVKNFRNNVKWDSIYHSVDHPPFAVIANESNVVPLMSRLARRKRCTCGCSGCDIFPNRACCGPSCCESSKPVPLACCPPPPPPKPCCQPNFGPCCPATPNCCRRPCCKGRRPEIYEEEDEDGIGAPPVAPAGGRACCPPSVPAAPPPPPVPPPPPPEAPVECCAPPPKPKSPCGCSNCGCGRPCCFYRDKECCRTKPCCPPQLPCCPPLPIIPVCCNLAPPCLRACPTCPCRKRVLLGKRTKRQNGLFDGLHCQQCMAPGAGAKPVQSGVKTAVALKTTPAPRLLEREEPRDIVEEAPMARGHLYEISRQRRVKRNGGCQICVDGRPLKREKRNACVQCHYLKPTYDGTQSIAPYGVDPNRLQTPVPYEMEAHLREKRNGCIPPPTCLAMRRRSKRNYNSQYCEPCPQGYHGRSKREAQKQQCMDRRKKRAAAGQSHCEDEEDSSTNDFMSITRMKRQAYAQNGALDIVKVLSKLTANRAAGPGGCLEFPACVLAQKKRRKRHAERVVQHQKAMKRYKREVKAHEKVVERHKRQFFNPAAAGAVNCIPCPAWVTLALTSRKKRDVEEDSEAAVVTENLDITDLRRALKDIRRREQEFLYEEDSCEQTADCMDDHEYSDFMRKFHLGKRKKRESSLIPHPRQKRCTQCQGKRSKGRSKRAFGAGPSINASAGNCYAFPACRTRVKRHNFECNVCTPDAEPLKKTKRAKRAFGQVQCFPCPASGK